MNDLTAAILAGGKSQRMGTDKALLSVAGKPIIEHVLERISGLGQAETILITNRPEDYAHLSLPMYADVIPGKGALGGVYSAISYSHSPYTLVTACDMPFLNPDLLRYMIALRNAYGTAYDVIVPLKDDHPQGTHALYSKACLDPIRTALEAGKLKLISFYHDVQVRYVDKSEYRKFDPDGLSFFNANTPEELEAARRLAEQSDRHPSDKSD